MKVLVKNPFFDERGLHKPGQIVDVTTFKPEFMIPVEEEEKEQKAEVVDTKDVKKPVRKTTSRRKKG